MTIKTALKQILFITAFTVFNTAMADDEKSHRIIDINTQSLTLYNEKLLPDANPVSKRAVKKEISKNNGYLEVLKFDTKENMLLINWRGKSHWVDLMEVEIDIDWSAKICKTLDIGTQKDSTRAASQGFASLCKTLKKEFGK